MAVDEAHEATGGNPFFVREVARAIVELIVTPYTILRWHRQLVARR